MFGDSAGWAVEAAGLAALVEWQVKVVVGRAAVAAVDEVAGVVPTPERHARFCVDTARAWEQFGRRDHAYQALSVAERHAPEELRRPSVRTLVANLLYSPGIPPSGLRALAARSGVLV